MKDFKNKTAIVTGATRGIGRRITEDLLKKGCNVVGVYEKRDDRAEQLLSEYEKVTMLKRDVAATDIGDFVVEKALEEFGNIDFLINNAGVFIGGYISDLDLEDWERIMDVNVRSKYLLTKAATPHLKDSDNAVVVNISSRFGLNDYVEPWCIPYSVTNSSINIFSVSLAQEFKEQDFDIRVNAVIPTVTNTDRFKDSFSDDSKKRIIKKGKLGEPEDVSEMVLNLIEDKSINGEIIVDERVYIE
jgi:3-oxoacyl-[acyl-carrier protein] reductase